MCIQKGGGRGGGCRDIYTGRSMYAGEIIYLLELFFLLRHVNLIFMMELDSLLY